MKQFVAAVLLFSLSVASLPTTGHAQARPRRVGGSGSTTTTALPTIIAAPSTTNSAPTRPPKLGGVTTPNSGAIVKAPPAPAAKDAGEEVGDDEIVRVNTSLVTIPVSVMDRDGRFLPDVRQSEFRVWEDGVEQRVAYFATVEKPFTVALVLDTSGSARYRLEDIQDAAIAFVNQLRPDDRVLVVAFDDSINVLAEATSDHARLRDAIRRTRTGEGTRLYDAVDFVINQRLIHVDGRKAVVLFTDGVDTTSKRASYEGNVRDAEELDALIYPVEYDTYSDANAGTMGGGSGGGGTIDFPTSVIGILSDIMIGGTRGGRGGRRGGGGGGGIGRGGGTTNCTGCTREEYERGDAYLRQMSDATGGRLYRADSTRNLAQAFSLIAEELRRQYSLGYYPQQTASAGQRRRIKVRVTRPNLVVRARDSYIFNPPGGATTQAQTDATRAKPVLQGTPLARY